MKQHHTLQAFLYMYLEDHPDVEDLVDIMQDLAHVGRDISHRVNRVGIEDLFGDIGEQNESMDQTQKLDAYANDLCKEVFRASRHFAAMASEEEAGMVDLHTPEARYIIAFDPLDGSSNIDVNVSIGTIFSVKEKRMDLAYDDPAQFFTPGSAQRLAGYILYGASTVMVFSFGDGQVMETTYDPQTDAWYLSREALNIPPSGPYYSINEAYTNLFDPSVTQYVQTLKQQGVGLRYVGSMVADVHRTLIKGGIFVYPLVRQTDGEMKAKLRVVYEVQPMGFLVHHAGGRAIDEAGRDVLAYIPETLHERQSCVLGSPDLVKVFHP